MFHLRPTKWLGAWRPVIVAVAMLAVVIVAGTISYHLVEGWGTFDALYQTIIVISTLGIREVHFLSRAGQVVTLFLVIGGFGTLTFAFTTIVSLLVEVALQGVLGRQAVKAAVAKLQDHFIVCGYGRMGRILATNLKNEGSDVAVIERTEPQIAQADADRIGCILGDAIAEESLQQAGIERAKGLVSVLPSDADNVFVTLTARGLNSRLIIVARAEDPATESKLRRAGANQVVSPHTIGARRISNLLLRPALVEFMDSATTGIGFEVEEYEVGPDSPLVGKPLRETDLREKAGVMIVAIKREAGKVLFSPGPMVRIHNQDILVCIGPPGSAAALAKNLTE